METPTRNNLSSLKNKKNFLYFRKWNFSTSSLKNSCFVFRTPYGFLLLILQMLSFHYWFLLLLIPFVYWLFFQMFYFTNILWRGCFLLLRFCVVVPRVLRIWESIFYSHMLFTLRSFPAFGTTCFINTSLGLAVPLRRCQALLLRFETDPSHLFVSITQYSAITWYVVNSI